MSGATITTGEYIKHHLTNLTFGYQDGHWGFAHSAADIKEMGFWAIHVDSLLWSVALGGLFFLLFYTAAKRATAEVPGGLQNFVEWIVEFVDESVKGSFSAKK